MKQNLNFDANQTNLLSMWQVQTERLNHIRRLNTIYRQKSHTYKNHAFQEHQNKNYMLLHLRNKEKDMQRKQKSLQHQIDYENQLLRNKLIDASLPKQKIRVGSFQDKTSDYDSSVTGKDEKGMADSRKRQNYKSQSYFKKQEKNKIIEQNAKLFVKLVSMKSDIMEKLNIKDHQKKTEQMKDKLQKRSPKKMKMLRSFFKKRNIEFGEHLFPIAAKSHQKHHVSVQNQQQQYIV